MDSNPICQTSSAKIMKCSFLDYVQLLMIGQAGQWTQTPSAISAAKIMKCSFLDYIQLLMISRAGQWTRTHLQPKNEMLIFGLHSTSDDQPGLVNGLKPHLPPLSSQKNEMLIFGLRSTSDDWLGWSMDSNPIHHRSPAKKMKCLFLDYIHLLMIGKAGRWTRTPSATHLQPKT